MTNPIDIFPKNLGEYYKQLRQLKKPIGFKSLLEFKTELDKLPNY
jgi:hypothetical protein